MSNHLEISQILEALRHPDADENSRQHLLECLECRAEMVALEALQAMALEAAPQPAPKLLNSTLQAIRQEELLERLAAQQGDEIARQIFSKRPDAPAPIHWRWVLFLFLLTGIIGGGWWYARLTSESLAYDQKPLLVPPLPRNNAPLPWASSKKEPTIETLAPRRPSRPEPQVKRKPQKSKVKRNKEIDRAVKSLLKRHLRGAEKKHHKTSKKKKATPRPTKRPTALPTPRPTKQPTALPTPHTTKRAVAVKTLAHSDIQISRSSVLRNSREKIKISLNIPKTSLLEIRIFDLKGKTARLLYDGQIAAGPQSFVWDKTGDNAKLLPAGTYYLRVLSPFISRVEALELVP